MSDFWEHLVNAAGHLLDAKRMGDAEAQARREAAAQARAQARKQASKNPAPAKAGQTGQSFASAPNNDPGCCIRRRFKVG